MAGVALKAVESKSDLNLFLKAPHHCQGHDPNWVAPLNMMVRDQLNPKKNPWFSHGDAQFWVAMKDGKPVGRISAQVDHTHQELYQDKTGFFGFFETIDEPDVSSALFDAAGAWLKDQGMTRVRGPYSLNINEETGLLIDGFRSRPRMMMGHAQPHYPEHVEAAGFEKAKDMVAFLTPQDTALPHKQLRWLERGLKRNPGLKMRHLDPKRFNEDIATIVHIFNAAWAENWGFIPLTEADIQYMAAEMKLILLPELVTLAFYDGEPAGFAIALPDLNEIIHDLKGSIAGLNAIKLIWRLVTRRTFCAGTRVPLMGVMPEYQGKPVGSIIGLHTIGGIRESALNLRMPICEMSWVLEDNSATIHSLSDIGGQIYKTYRVYEKAL